MAVDEVPDSSTASGSCQADVPYRQPLGARMSRREMSLLLKAIDLLAVLSCLVVAIAAIPPVEARGVVPPGSALLFVLGILPLVVLAAVAWRLFSAIGAGEVFTQGNALLLRRMGYLAAADAAVWLAELVAYLAFVAPVVFSVVASLSVALVFSVSLAVVCVALSGLTQNAAQIKDENDLVV